MTFKKVLCVLVIGIMVLSATACANNLPAGTAQTPAKDTAPAAEQPSAQAKIPLKLWHIYGGTDPNAESLAEIIKTAEGHEDT